MKRVFPPDAKNSKLVHAVMAVNVVNVDGAYVNAVCPEGVQLAARQIDYFHGVGVFRIECFSWVGHASEVVHDSVSMDRAVPCGVCVRRDTSSRQGPVDSPRRGTVIRMVPG